MTSPPTKGWLKAHLALPGQHIGTRPHTALWWQYAELAYMLGDLGVREAGTFLDDLTEQMGALLVTVSDQLIQLARRKEPPPISTADVEEQFR